MIGYEEVSRKVYNYFVLWANEHVEGIRSESVTVADKVIIRKKDDDVIAYVDMAYGITYYVRKDFYTSFTSLKEFRI